MLCLVSPNRTVSAQGVAPVTTPTATTVERDVFRSRWTGRQVDASPRALAGQAIEPEAYEATPVDPDFTSLEALGMTPLFDVASPFRRGIAIGPVDLNLALAVGWEYSSRSATGRQSEESDDNSPFVAPALRLTYDRAIGPWSVAALYSGGFRYYTNPGYAAAGSGSQRNPISQTGSLQIGHLGARHEVNVTATGSFGTGLDVNSGTTLTQTQLGTGVDYEYLLAQFYTVGADANYRTTISSDQGDGRGSGNGGLSSVDANAYLDYLWTGKTTLRFTLGAGQDQQALTDQASEDRRYVQSLLSVNYRPKEKFTFNAGFGLGYVGGSGNESNEFTGLRPVYNLGILYQATPKTSISANFGLQGTEIRPNFRLQLAWQPRDTTATSLAVYQNQAFSLNTSNQTQISRGIVGSLTQRVFSRVTLTVSAGWQQTEDVDLGGNNENFDSDDTFAFSFASADLNWQIRDWVSWTATLYGSTGSNDRAGGDEPETRASISFDFAL